MLIEGKENTKNVTIAKIRSKVANRHSPYLKQRLIVVSNYFIAGGTFGEFEVADPARTTSDPSAKFDSFEVRTHHQTHLRLR